jgi:uncharacterized BrkB/YihY/UPF0761 family membrane protein
MGPRRVRLIDTGKRWARQVARDDTFGLAAELAYWFFLSLFPFFIFLAALGSFIAALFNVQDPTQQIVDLLGASTAFILLAGAELNAVVDEQLEPDRIDEERRRHGEAAAMGSDVRQPGDAPDGSAREPRGRR